MGQWLVGEDPRHPWPRLNSIYAASEDLGVEGRERQLWQWPKGTSEEEDCAAS